MSRPKIRTATVDVDVTPAMKERLNQTALKLNICKADVTRHAIEMYTTRVLGEESYLGLY